MKPTITLIRAIGTEFARRAIKPIIIIGIIVALVLLTIGGWLASRNAWWWFLEGVFIGLTILFAIIVVVIGLLLRALNPVLKAKQKSAVVLYVDKLQRVAENLQTPQFVILYLIVRDVIRPRSGSFIETVSKDSKSLAPDLAKLHRLF